MKKSAIAVGSVRRSLALACAGALLLVGCGSAGETATEQTLAGIGRIPGVDASAGALTVDGIRAALAALEGPQVGANAQGNRLLVIGDSIFAATASRYGGAMCKALEPLGWRVAVEAEAGQMVSFGRTVIRERIYEGWDAAVVFLGTNYGGNEQSYSTDLTRIVESLAPRPTLLLTASVFKPSIAQVNRVIRTVAAKNPHVSVLDWSTASAQAGVLNRDKVHPTDAGRQLLVASVAAALGQAPTAPGKCLASVFVDDSLINEDDVLPSTTVASDAAAADSVGG